MASAYKHGAYGELDASAVSAAASASAIPLLVGTAPVNLIRGYADLVNKPIRLADIGAKKEIGYSEDYKAFTLCEVVDAFFDNDKGNVGPIYIINVLNPDTHRKNTQTTTSVTFTNGKGYIKSDRIIIDSLAIADKAEGTDYTLSYNFNTGKLLIDSSKAATPLDGAVSVTYNEVNPAAVTDDDIIGAVSEDGEYTGLQVGSLMYPQLNVIVNLIAAPGWSEHKAVYQAMVEFAQRINQHWYAFVLADMPLSDDSGEDTVLIDTIAKAKEWKTKNEYGSMYDKIWWPQSKTASGRIFHLSTLAAVEALRADTENDGVPMQSISNISVPVAAQYFGEGSKNQGFDNIEANSLNEAGISTLTTWGGERRLWGPHTGAFAAGADGNAVPDLDPLGIFDVNIRMQEYVLNAFQEKWGNSVDKGMTIALRDQILEDEQQKLDALVAVGAFIGSPKIVFLESENSRTDIMNGNFVFNFSTTPTPPAKSLTAKIAYTDAGFSAYFESED